MEDGTEEIVKMEKAMPAESPSPLKSKIIHRIESVGTKEIVKMEEAVPAECLSSLESKIIRQIEFYFGVYNLSRDKFLRLQIGMDDGWVPLKLLIKFKKLKKLSEDLTIIAEALKKSPKQLMEVNKDCTKIRRRVSVPIPDNYHKNREMLDKKTLYVEGFKRTDNFDKLLDFFGEYNVERIVRGKKLCVKNKPFKDFYYQKYASTPQQGSVFVTFETEDDAQKFLDAKGIKCDGVELLKQWKTDYVKRKEEYFKNLKEAEAKKLEDNVALINEKNEGKNEIKMIPGSLLKLTGLQSYVFREKLREVFEEFGAVDYVDYFKGQPNAVIRFESGIAKSVLEKLPEKDGRRRVKICCRRITSDAEVFLLEGDDESEYWKNIEVSWAESHLKFNKGFKNHHGNNDREDECSQPKRVKTENEKPEAESLGENKNKVKIEADS